MLARIAVIVCLSVRPSQVGVVQRWLNLGLHKQRHTIAQIKDEMKDDGL